MSKINNIKYGIIPSTSNKLVEVAVTYEVNGTFQRYFIFLRKMHGWSDKAYLDAAKKKFEADTKAGKVKVNTSRPHTNKGLAIFASILGITTIGLGAFIGYEYFTGNLGGGSYQPGQQVKVEPVVEDPSGGNYKVTLTNYEAKVGEKYHTIINLVEKNDTSDDYVLPDKLVSVISNTTALKEEQYTYVPGEDKTSATLDINGEYVYGPVAVSLVLVSTSQPGPGPGPGPQPGPINWETITKEEAENIRCNIIGYQSIRNPLDLLKEEFDSTQFKLTKTYTSEYGQTNEGDSHDVYYIDSDALYIKKADELPDPVSGPRYCTYHSDASDEDDNGVYECFIDDYSKDKNNKVLYNSPSLELAKKTFVPANPLDEDWANTIYCTNAYRIDGDGQIAAVKNFYKLLENIGIEEADYPPMTYEKGNDLSLKITASTELEFYGYEVIANFEFVIENALLTNMTSEMSIVGMLSMSETVQLETATFALDDLSEYFAK